MNNYQDVAKTDISFSLQGILCGSLSESDWSSITLFLIAVRQEVKSKDNSVVQELELAISYTLAKIDTTNIK